MAEAGNSYDPASGLRVNTQAEKLDGGIGLGGDKPVPTLRIFGSNIGNQWLCYGTIGGGTQHYEPPLAGQENGECEWFRFYYTGIMEIAGEAFFGNWKVTVEGEGLEPVVQQIGKHTKPTLRVGDKTINVKHPITVDSITIEPYKPKKMKIIGGDEVEDENEPGISKC